MTHAARASKQQSARYFSAIFAFFPTLVACSSGTANAGAPAPAPAPSGVSRADIVDVVYEQGTNDEGVLTLLGAPPVSEASAEPVVTAPKDQDVLSGPVTFAYRVGAGARRERKQLRPREHALPAWLTLERTAFAHGIPMNGDAFLLVFSTAAAPKLLRVFTQDKSYEPSDDDWQRLVGQSAPVTLTITHAIFEQGRLTEDGGPFVGKALHFTVAD